jgi:hypothetical protein
LSTIKHATSESKGFSTSVTFDDNSYEGELRHIQLELDRQHSFIVAGLTSIGRVDEQGVGWDVLAERFGWKTSMKARVRKTWK